MSTSTPNSPTPSLTPSQQAIADKIQKREDDQLEVSAFEPHHSTMLIYPDCSLLRDTEHLFLGAMDDSIDTKFRHEPLPLIRDEAVTNHADRENEAEVSFFTRKRARATAPDFGLPRAPPTLMEFERLARDMEMAECCVGSTTLNIVTYQQEYFDGTFSKSMVRVIRDTGFRQRGRGAVATPKENYVFSVANFCEQFDLGQEAPWYIGLRSLWLRSSDRAYKHVRVRLAMQDQEDEHVACYGFKAARREDFGRLLDSKLTPVNPANLRNEDKSCPVCTGTLGEGEAKDPVSLPCSGKHITCKSCVLAWTDSVGPERASCPQCRDKIFGKQSEVDDLRFGLVDGVYKYDDRYTDFENFERSCADLDQERAENKEHPITLHAELLICLWDDILDGEDLAPNDKCYQWLGPQYLQPLLFPEWKTADEVLRHQLRSRDGVTTTPGAIFHGLLEVVYGAFYLKHCQAGLDQGNSPQEMQTLLADPVNAECLDIRPGFKEFFKRCLNRTLRAFELRKCSCQEGLHDHGVRTYYNPSDISVYVAGHGYVDGEGDLNMSDCCE